MTQEIEYTKFETCGFWRESVDTQELEVVVSFGKSSLLLKDFNEVVLAQWSFPTISKNESPNGEISFSPDEDGVEMLRIIDDEMVQKLQKVIQSKGISARNYNNMFFLLFIFSFAIFFIYNSKEIFINIATSITPTEKTSIVFEKLFHSKKTNIGQICKNKKGQDLLKILVSNYKYLKSISIIKSELSEFYLLPDGQVFISENLIVKTEDPLEISNLLSAANDANKMNIPLNLFFSTQSFISLGKYISGLTPNWNADALTELNIKNILNYEEVKISNLPVSLSGLEWVRIQNICLAL